MLSGKDRRVGPDDDAFIEALSRLKRQGASLLVVGSNRPDQQRDACRRLLGRATGQPRRRVLVSTTGEKPDVSRLVDDVASDTLKVVTYETQARSAATTHETFTAPSGTDSPTEPSLEETTTTAETLADLGIAISSAVETLDTAADGLAPSELRVGIDSLLPLLEEYGREQVFRFIHLANGRTRDANGMIHYHLPVERDASLVSVLSPLFDIIVELREQNGVLQERWSLNDGDLCSGWVSATQT